MFKYTEKEINEIARKANFNINTCEKVLRLSSILDFFQASEISTFLVLKGGTAINLFLLDLPRLSVDIDLDFNLPLDRLSMFSYRSKIDSIIKNFMQNEGYILSEKSKFVHTLDSYIYSYQTTSGSMDTIKIEINYSDRVHVLKTITKESTDILGEKIEINTLSTDELIGSKINALLVRTTPRDVFDVYSIFKNKQNINTNLIKKIAIFYVCLGSETPINFQKILLNSLEKIQNLNYQKIKETLIPVLHKGIKFDVSDVTTYVLRTIKELFILDENDTKFINDFNEKIFSPDILFSGFSIEDVSKHQMALWKTK